MVVIALFVALAGPASGPRFGRPTPSAASWAAGITAWISFQAIINICVVLMLVPVTGITLPFVSQGGSSLIVSFAAVWDPAVYLSRNRGARLGQCVC